MEPTEDSETQNEQKPKNPKNRFRMDPEERKAEDERRRRRRGRVIVRNISYKSTEEALRKHFSQYGNINEVNILKRPDGKLVGCAFIQFEKVNEAAKAILKATNKEFLGRPVYVDWAVGKDQFNKQKEAKVKDEPKVEKEDGMEEDVKSEPEEEPDSEAEVKSEAENESVGESDEDMEASGEEDHDSGEEDGEGSDEEDEKKSKIKIEDDGEKKPKRISNDVNEGCTVFIKNVPFDATVDDLRKCCRKYGPLYYALINTDPVSGHSKGTGFVKFKAKESADMCLAAGEEFVLLDTIMEPMPALSREELRNQKDATKRKDPSDSRNLYLVKEGLIMAGSKAAEGVSASDMNKRHKLEQTKTQILKSLNRFVSRNRLSVHNLPLHYDDEKLRKMVIRFTGFTPHECRVMRENRSSPGFPQGKPKGFGFISFKTHEDALKALRKLNNNPTVFSPQARPIVGFSIEDRSVHKIKQRRTQKSRENNPTYKEKLEKLKARRSKKKSEKKDDKSKVQNNINKKATSEKVPKADDKEFESYVGTAAMPGAVVKMRSSRKIKEQAKVHLKRVSDQKRKEKQRKEKLLHRIERKQIERPKKGKKKVDKDQFSQLVNKYKQLLDRRNEASAPGKAGKRSKWYAD